MNNRCQVSRMKRKEKHTSEGKRVITTKVSAEFKKLIDKERKLTGETISKFIERALANFLNSNQTQPPYSNNQELLTHRLREIANDLRQISHKIDKIATKQASDRFEALNVVVVSKKLPWQNHPQKEKIYKLVRAMHRVGANLDMITDTLNIEVPKKSTRDGEWRVTDVKKIIDEIKQESDYLAPIYTSPDNQ